MIDEAPFRVLVADDEPLARQRLRSLLAGDPEVVLVLYGDRKSVV